MSAHLFEITDELDGVIRARCQISAADLLDRIRHHDDELMQKGYDPGSRQIHVGRCLSIELNTRIIMDDRDPISALSNAYYKLVYGPDLAMGPQHVGAIMMRDVFFEVHVPHVFGRVAVNPWDFIKSDRAQLNVLCSMGQEDVSINSDQLIDISDFGFGYTDFITINKGGDAADFLSLAKEQIEGACRTLTGSFSKRVAMQGVAYAVEMAGKALLLHHGLSKKGKLRYDFGHDLVKIFQAIKEGGLTLDHERISTSVAEIPNVIGQRYNFDSQNRIEIGNVIRQGQYVLGEVLRSVGDRDIRRSLTPMPARTFPVEPDQREAGPPDAAVAP